MRFSTPRRPVVSIVFALLVAVATLGALVALPGSAAAETTAMDATILAGPGWEYEPLTYAPAGSPISVDGAAVGSFVPVTYAGTSGWADVSVVGAGSATLAQEAPPAEAAAPVDAAPVEETPPVETAPAADAAAPAPAEASTTDAAGVSEEAVVAEDAAPAEGTGRSGRGNGGQGDLAPPPGDSIAAGGDSAYGEEEIIGIIREAAATHGQDPQAMIRVARCESGLNPSAVGAGIYFGLFQFVPSTFEGTPYGDGDIFDPWANANAAGWMWAEGRKGEWVCQ